MTPTAEDFEIWLENDITRWVFAGLKNIADDAMKTAMVEAWSSSVVDQPKLDRAKMRHEAYSDFAGLTYEDALALHPNEIPQEETRDAEGA